MTKLSTSLVLSDHTLPTETGSKAMCLSNGFTPGSIFWVNPLIRPMIGRDPIAAANKHAMVRSNGVLASIQIPRQYGVANAVDGKRGYSSGIGVGMK